MAIPTSVSRSLANKQIGHEIIEANLADKIAELLTQENTHEQLAVMVLLEVSGNKLQAIVPSTSILNLDVLNEHTGQHVQPVLANSTVQLLSSKGLETLPAIPDITGYQTFIDSSLLTASTVLMASGNQHSMLSMSQGDFALLVKDCLPLALAIPVKELPGLTQTRKDDSNEIYAAIRNYTSLQIKKRLTDTLEIPPLPVIAQKILKLSADQNADINDLVKVIELDPSLAAQVVGWAASPYYSAPGKVKSIQDAVIRVLGFELVLNLALGLAMGQSLKVPQHGACSITLFWRQAVYCALTMEKLNRLVPSSIRGQAGFAYLAGLMNNFGYLILNHVFPAHFSTLCLYMNANPHINPVYIEQHLLGITSEQMCGQLAEAWNLPLEINNALRFQQVPHYDGPDALYANLCFISTRILARIGISTLPKEEIPESLYNALQLNPEDIESLIEDIRDSQDDIDMMLSSLAA